MREYYMPLFKVQEQIFYRTIFYKIVGRIGKTPIGQRVRQYNAQTIDEVEIVVVSEGSNSSDIILHRKE